MQNWAAFRLGHGGAVRGMIPAQAPYEGGEPTMRKGSYSEELVKNDSRGGRHQSCSIPQDEANNLRLVSTFMPSKRSELAKSKADVGDVTPLEHDEKLPDVMGLQLLNVQVPSLEQDAGGVSRK